MSRDFAQGFQSLLVERVVGILGNESKVRVKGGKPQFLGEIGSLLEVGDSLRAVLPGTKPIVSGPW